MIGKNSKSFYLKFEKDWFNKGETITGENGSELIVVKAYKLNWWRKILLKLGFSVKFYEVKVKEK